MKHLFWDFDGTLIYSNNLFFDALCIALKDSRYEANAEEVWRLMRAACSWHAPEISYTEKTGQRWWDSLFEHLRQFYEEHKIAKEDTEKINMVFKGYVLDFRNHKLYHDAEMVLCRCKEMGCKNYIISNNFPELPLVINDLGLSKYFTDYIVSSNIGYEKPRAEIFQYALSAADFSDDCCIIGDNAAADVQGGKAAGMKTILVHNDTVSEADFVCENLSEIPVLLTCGGVCD